MGKSTFKVIALFGLMIMLFSIFCASAQAAVNTKDKVVLKEAETQYLIYYKDVVNEEFEFAYSSNKDEAEANLNFRKSAKDKSQNDSLNIAYIDEELYNEFFKDKKEAYIWIRDSKDEIVVKADLLNLEEALTKEQIDLVNSITEKIEVDTTQTETSEEKIDGVDITTTKGKVVIKANGSKEYSYMLLDATNKATDAGALYELAEKFKGMKDTYSKLEASEKFYKLYTNLLPTDSEWQKVENLEIMQPEDSEDGDKYIVYIKEEAEEPIVDAKFLVSKKSVEDGTNTSEHEVEELVDSPVTFDTGIFLFIALAVIIILLIIFLVIRKKQNKEE